MPQHRRQQPGATGCRRRRRQQHRRVGADAEERGLAEATTSPVRRPAVPGDSAKIARSSSSARGRCRNRRRPAGSAASASTASGERPGAGAHRHPVLEQAVGPPQQDHRHQHVDQHAGRLRQQHLAEGVDDADQQRGQRARRGSSRCRRSRPRRSEMISTWLPMPGYTDDTGAAIMPASDGERHAGREHDAVEQPDVDAQRLHHLAIARTRRGSSCRGACAVEHEYSAQRHGDAHAGR